MTENPDQKRTRRRWINLAEVVGVAGLLIAGLSLWQGREDRWADTERASASAAAELRERARLELTATVTDGGRSLKLADARHDLSDATIAYPRALGVAVQHPPGEPVIDATPFAATLLKLTDGGPDERTGRLPVLVTVRYVDDDSRTSSGIYDVVWRTQGRMLRGRELELTGLRLRQRGGNQAALDAAWARVKP